MKRKIFIYGGFFVVLISLFLVFVFAGSGTLKSKSPVISYVMPFSFTDQNGHRFTDKNMEGKVCVVNFFFTTCKGICPKMNGNLYALYNNFKSEKDFLLVSHTCDPERDSAERLKQYADSLKVDTRKWVFLTGRKDSLYTAARINYLLDDPNNNVKDINDQFLHTQFVAVVDKHGNVRGQIYDALKEDDMQKLQEAVKALLKES